MDPISASGTAWERPGSEKVDIEFTTVFTSSRTLGESDPGTEMFTHAPFEVHRFEPRTDVGKVSAAGSEMGAIMGPEIATAL